MCASLCSSSPCLGTKDALLFAAIDRYTIVTYTASISMYFIVIAIPCAGAIFGSWLALTLNVFKSQYNEGFSSLRIQHWKNVLKCHVKSNGDLEVYGLGLDRVPKSWVKDAAWGGSAFECKRRERERQAAELRGEKQERGDIPSWRWERPSKWVPEKGNFRHVPRIIDHTVISKRDGGSRGRGVELERNLSM